MSGAGAPATSPGSADVAFAPFLATEVEQSIPARFAAQVERHAERPAVLAADERLTYAALDRAANGIARMVARDTSPDAPVVLAFERGARQIVALLGVLKAGRPYVPLDLSLPARRLAALAAESGATLAIADARGRALLGDVVRCRAPEGDDAAAAPAVDVSPDAPAYVLWTSGSSGEPKGVVQSHRTVLHNVMKYTNGARLSAGDRLSLLPSYAVGASASDIFGALLNGAVLCPFDVGVAGLDALASWLERELITVYHSVPSLFRALCGVVAPGGAWPALRLVKLGGEPLYRGDVERFRAIFPPTCTLLNGLGTTECNVVRQNFITPDTPLSGEIVPVGWEVADTTVLILDATGGELPAGESGEIAIRSRHLALGYWRRPDLTAAAFQEASGRPGERIYRTGDLGRLRPDGCLEHLGRIDQQVKIRGHRVEPAEVEAALAQHPEVREAAVTTYEVGPGDRRLAACVVASGSEAPRPAALRAFLRERVPAFMIPERIVLLDALPRLPSGKIDRGALPVGSKASPAGDPPRDPLEQELARLWAEVLQVAPLGRTDDFFELGGESLAAVRLLARIRRSLGQELSLATFVETPTIAGLARVLRAGGIRVPTRSLVAVQPLGGRTPFFCVHPVGGHVLRFYDLARLVGVEHPFYGFQAPEPHRSRHDDYSIAGLAARYVAALDAVHTDEPLVLGGMCTGGLVAYEMARQRAARGRPVPLVVLIDTVRIPHATPPSAGPVAHGARAVRLLLRSGIGRLLRRSREAVGNVRRNVHRTQGPVVRPHDWTGDQALTEWVLALTSREARQAIRVRRALLAATRTYRPGPYSGRVVLIRAQADDANAMKPQWDWRGAVGERLETIVVPGSHHFMMRHPHVAVVAERLRALLDGVDA